MLKLKKSFLEGFELTIYIAKDINDFVDKTSSNEYRIIQAVNKANVTDEEVLSNLNLK